MIQEIITYIIILSVIFIAVRKIILNFRKKRKRRPAGCNIKPSLQSNCFGCTADCIFRQQVTDQDLKPDSRITQEDSQ
jgi:hypothetical protein